MEQKVVHNKEEVNEVLSEYADMVYRLAASQTSNRADADDVFQEVFLRFMSAGPPLEEKNHVKAWLIRVTINCSRNLMKSGWFRYTVPLDETLCDDTAFPDGDIYQAVQKLPKKYRTVIHLFYYEDLSIDQISNILQIKQTTIASQLCRARKFLKDKLKGEYEYD